MKVAILMFAEMFEIAIPLCRQSRKQVKRFF
jgi:hypothetical protein